MKNVLLIGDSIRRGYDAAVKKTLEGKAQVYYPEDNCRMACYTLRYLHEYKDHLPNGAKVDVLHWNAGLWDCLRFFGEDPHTPLDIYTYYIDRICQRILKLFPDAKVVFATSTSVNESNGYDNRFNREIEDYNAAAVAVVKKYGFYVNDLYALSASLPMEAHSDAVHYYTPMGTEAFANQVLDVICPLLGLEEALEYKEELYTDAPVGV